MAPRARVNGPRECEGTKASRIILTYGTRLVNDTFDVARAHVLGFSSFPGIQDYDPITVNTILWFLHSMLERMCAMNS